MPGNEGFNRGAPAASSTAAQHQALSDQHRARYQRLTESIAKAGARGDKALANRLAGHAADAAKLYRAHQAAAAQVARRDAPRPVRPAPADTRRGGTNRGSVSDELARAFSRAQAA